MDEADRSFQEEHSFIANGITIARRGLVSSIFPLGYCRTCFEDLDKPKLFCDNICADQYNKK